MDKRVQARHPTAMMVKRHMIEENNKSLLASTAKDAAMRQHSNTGNTG